MAGFFILGEGNIEPLSKSSNPDRADIMAGFFILGAGITKTYNEF
jgi:hypothetical protein